MQLSIRTYLQYTTSQPCNVLLQIEAASDLGQTCIGSQLDLGQGAIQHEPIGNGAMHRWVSVENLFTCEYRTLVDIHRPRTALDDLKETPLVEIPNEVIKYLLPSRYCHPELFLDFIASEFVGLQGGALVSAIKRWIFTNFTYDNGVSHAGTTAADSFASLSGVCRDYAHVMIASLRAIGIPARFVSAYAPDVLPKDFHAVVEVYLEGQWHLVDPTGMSSQQDIARICTGRDAADASFMTSYGWMDLITQSVEVARC